MVTYALRIGEGDNHVVEYYWNEAAVEKRIRELKEIFPTISLQQYHLSEGNVSLDRGIWKDGHGDIGNEKGKFTNAELLKYVFRL